MTTSTFLDDRQITLVKSANGRIHVEGWFGQTLCGNHVYFGYNQWEWHDLTSLRWLGKIAQGVGYGSSTYCKRCINNYKDVNIDG